MLRKLPLRGLLCLLALLVLSPGLARAERPTAPKMLPEETLAYIRVHKMPELIDRFQKTSAGKLAADEKIRPLLGQLYASMEEAFGQVEDNIGLSLSELLAIPQGEVCLAFVAPEDGNPAGVLLLEVAEQLPSAEKLLDKLHETLINQGGKKKEEKFGETPALVFSMPDGGNLVQFDKDGTFCFCTDVDVAKNLVSVWDGAEAQTLSDNRRFLTIMRRCAGTADERPQLSWYVDPIGIAKRLGRGNLGAQAGLAILDPIGLNGFKAVGGSIYFAGEEFDSIAHTHVMLANPREGVIKMLALKPGDITPEPWVPKDVASYATLHWDFNESYTTLNELVTLFRGEGSFEEMMQGVSDQAGVDIKTELVDALDGRISMLTWMQKPVTINSQTTMIAVKLKDADKFSKTMGKLIDRFADRFAEEKYRGITFYRFQGEGRFGRPGQDGERGPPRQLVRRPEPCLAIVGDYLMGTDSKEFLKQVITAKSRGDESLANQLDFKLIASRIGRHSKTAKPCMISFQRPEEALRWMYELATADSTRDTLSGAADSNPVFKALNDALNDNPLPPFAEIAKYLAPAGSMVISDETGIHYMGFGLKRE